MRAHEFISEEEKLDEVLPLIVGAARVGAAALGRGAAVAGRGAVKGATALGRGVVNTVGATKAVAGAAQKLGSKIGQNMGEPQANDPNAKVDPAQQLAANRAKDQLIRPGANLRLPTAGTGGPQDFKVSKVQGDEVEIENPNATMPGEPKKVVYKKDAIKQSISI